MARSDLLINLVKSGASGDKHTLGKIVDAIVAEERAKNHNIVADRIEKAYRLSDSNWNGKAATLMNAHSSESNARARDFIAEVKPRRRFEELILPEVTMTAAQQLVEEQQRASLLRSHSLEPRHSALLVGPPGNGKTSLAEAIAESLAVPFFVVRYETMIGSFLGETASRMKRVFDYARTTPCVLFFDEFDTVGKERGDTHETGEIKRVVTSLLLQIDDLPSYVVILAATNHAELLDRAVWRRFQLRLPLPSPTQKQIASYLTALSDRSELKLGASPQQIAKSLGKVSFSEAEEFFLDLARRQVLAAGEETPAQIAKQQLKIWASRVLGPLTQKQDDNAGTPTT
ncbi:AAA family ATPase [Paracoccus albus]|uniref:AAA family ATPase n=1 Tax=Paracoccus albus TaxID=3017784 RepID=UPI0022F0FDEE|nr:ATP-binding protein [Paracoccus albus]WBU62207.1 ATP-binding protein [Paracoccus albus]